tara:strand:+ start:707 stop:1264 length:558 start_codon:yes stop_codon:yes gene_type:complete
MSNSFSELGFFAADLILSFLVLIFTLRILLALSNANAYNPITQTIIKITRPIKSVLFFIPNLGKFEISSFVVICLCHVSSYYIQGTIIGSDIILERVLIYSLKSSIFSIFNALTIIFIILAISSWFVQSPISNRNPVLDIIYQISNPILFFIRRFIPTTVGVIDFSVIIALIIIYFIQSLVNILI